MGKKVAAIAAALGFALTTGIGVSIAQAYELTPEFGESGVVYDVPEGNFVIGANNMEEAVPLTTVNVGGGTWNYGSYANGFNVKRCYSHYIHKDKYHSAAVAISDRDKTDYAAARDWAKIDLDGGWFDTCNTF
ncbi:lactococcin 972 family bacteriocin [Bifidobacterium vespertilionis]|uniref:Lactococcin 972 family bacteriocin n=1 Tax=Bifidobacterium vespertilionis TaxID=2562524 RepID=A0A5J5E2Y2_9BIFI|nr:lactococcin 972 family bacteriocin [Bifidobacterium vespertilionis]KAA8822033.1 lactococcin 972 family bacteriocin [Bifidobacterium vespertilionis]KAA8823526.1 lactococcin 972 family bacteriocin [Bifidobacterium vespertilionis]